MKVLSIVLVLVFNIISTKAQNLILNGSFETQNACCGSIADAPPWVPASFASPPLFDSASTFNPYYGVPHNLDSLLGYQFARSGHAYAAIVVYWDSILLRTYLGYPLTNNLIAGKTYCFEFFVNLCNNSRYGINSIGAYFSNSPIYCSTNSCLFNFVPQIKNPINRILLDTLSWTAISGCYLAVGDEKYITIGNFVTDSLVLKDTSRSISSINYSTLYYIDDVSLYEDSSNAITELSKNLSVSLSPNPAANTIRIISGEQLELFDLKVYNNTGTQVFFQQGVRPNEAINVEALFNGFYYYIIATEKGEFATGKFVVQKDK